MTGKILSAVVVQDATAMSVQWRNWITLVSPTAITVLDIATMKVRCYACVFCNFIVNCAD